MSLIDKVFPHQFQTFFLFPFGFNHTTELKTFIKEFEKNKIWKYHSYKFENGIDYNEFEYFYPHIRRILFSNKELSSGEISRGFLKLEDNVKVNLSYQVINELVSPEIDITLPLKQIYLHLFENGTGLLAFEIDVNEPTYSLQDYLIFLDLGRRIYPPFVDSHYEIKKNNKHSHAFDSNSAISTNQCPSQIKINGLGINENYIENFEFNKNRADYGYLSNIITDLLDMQNFSYSNGDYWPLVDDRMYCHTYYDIFATHEYPLNGHFLNLLKNYFREPLDKREINDAGEIWYMMIFIDSDYPTCGNRFMINDLIDSSTYKRWTDWGGFYGFSRYSSAFISNSHAVPYFKDHFESMYYQLALILFFYRGSLLSFSERAIEIAKKIKSSSSIKELQKLQEDFLLFENKYWFKEVTAQDQGIEIFDLWESKMRNNILLSDVKEGIVELFEYFDAKREKDVSRKLAILTYIGSFLIPLNIAIAIISIADHLEFSILGKNIFLSRVNLMNIAWIVFIVSFIIIIPCLWKERIIKYFRKVKNRFKHE